MNEACNQKLSSLYESHKNELFSAPQKCTGKMHGPFLVCSQDEYWKSNIKISFVGQETRGWSCKGSVTEQMDKHKSPITLANKNTTGSVTEQMDKHKSFALGKGYHSSPFWNVIRKFEERICGSKYNSSWLNLNRYDQNKKRPNEENRKILSELDFLVLKELEILAPDVVIFFTGPIYDGRVKSLLCGELIGVSGFTKRELCLVKSQHLGAKIIRTYHPNYLRRSGLEEKVIDAVVSIALNGGA